VSDTETLVGEIVRLGGAIHPDVAPKGLAAGLIVVGVSDDVAKTVTIEQTRIAAYFDEHPTAPTLETSRAVLWQRSQVLLEGAWRAAGEPAFDDDPEREKAWERLDEVWRANRLGQRLTEFPRALRSLRSAMLRYFKTKEVT
jgi:hypothetical protein